MLSEAIVSSQVGASKAAEIVPSVAAVVFSKGGAIHAGGPREAEYSWRIFVMLGTSVGRSALLVLTMGESVLREKMSAVTFSYPGTWQTLNL